ncbi:hypothetical protein SDC9_21017 [bioreactor metagenome]|jgi:type I restriction enzyme S subunit|uniref:Type I restriction modification DNA specificity domain-containing protein n=1 Tax=bioreactor metagenome TaxID=1076179 RepID=A0A644U8C2_9ZZZZ|nr:restriction endonuclease subunit S [Lentimicrobium sp.]MEA5109924.1 restriction endonuclease subunit S [Lentimicrobium sp.]
MTWIKKKLGEVLTIERGGSPRPIDKYLTNSPDGINWIKISDATASDKCIFETKEKITKEGLHKTRMVNEGDFILSNSMSFGRPYIMKTSGCIHDGWLVLKEKGQKIFDTEFLYYLLSSPYVFNQFDYLAAGSTVRNLNIALVSSVEVPIPPLPEQQRIVSILDEAFAAIARAKANAEQNLKNAKELFESYLQGVFENKGDDWEEKKLGKVFVIKPLKKEAKEKLSDNDLVSFLPMEDLGVCENEIKPIKKRPLKDVAGSYTYFAENDVLLAKITPCFENGKLGVAKNLINGIGFGSSEYIVFRCPENIVPEFLFYFLSRESLRKEGKKYMSGAVGHKRVSKDWIENYIFSFPKSKEEQQAIIHQLDALRAETQKLEAVYQQKLLNLEELKKSVLQKAFAGELT